MITFFYSRSHMTRILDEFSPIVTRPSYDQFYWQCSPQTVVFLYWQYISTHILRSIILSVKLIVWGPLYTWRVVWEVFNLKARRLFLLVESIAVSCRRRIQQEWFVLIRNCNLGFPELTNNWRAHELSSSNIIVKYKHRK